MFVGPASTGHTIEYNPEWNLPGPLRSGSGAKRYTSFDAGTTADRFFRPGYGVEDMNLFRKAVLATGLAATALVGTFAGVTPAMARDWPGEGHRGGNDTAAVAIGAGLLGLAIAASGSDRRHDERYYDYGNGWSYGDGYYRDRDGGRHPRGDYERGYRGGRDHEGRDHDDYRRGYGRDGDGWRRGY